MRLLVHDMLITNYDLKTIVKRRTRDFARDSPFTPAAHNAKLVTASPQLQQRFANSVN